MKKYGLGSQIDCPRLVSQTLPITEDGRELLILPLPLEFCDYKAWTTYSVWCVQGWRWNPGLPECYAITLPTELHPQSPKILTMKAKHKREINRINIL